MANFNKTVLILGAGITRSARPKATLGYLPPLDADFFRVARAGSKKRTEVVAKILRDLVGEYADSLMASLETSTTFLHLKALDADRGSPYHNGYLALLDLLLEVLARTTNRIPAQSPSILYRFLLSELGTVEKPEDVTIITFNYDLLLERVLEAIASTHGRQDVFAFPGCYRLGPHLKETVDVRRDRQFEPSGRKEKGVALLKLHGSMSWQSRHSAKVPTPNQLYNPKRGLYVVDSPYIRQYEWTLSGRTYHLKPIIIPPVSGKRGMMHEAVVSLWTQAASALRNADRIIIAGYSCPPLDLEARILFSENARLNDGKRVVVIDPNPEAAAKFFDLCGVDHLTTYLRISDFVRDAPRARAVGR